MAIRFNKEKFRYELDGRAIAPAKVQAEIQRLVDSQERQMRRLTEQLRRGRISLPEWQLGMRDLIKSGNTVAGSIGRGGHRQMSAADWGTVGQRIRTQYAYLNRFALEIENGRVPDASSVYRAGLYARSVRIAFYVMERRALKDAGFTESRRILLAKESCVDCLEWRSRGWVPVDQQPMVGTLICKQNCRCQFEYRK